MDSGIRRMKYRLIMSLLIGTGLVGLAFTTMDLTWLGGISLLMPGILLLSLFPYKPILDSTPTPMLIANDFIYSVASFVVILIVARSVSTLAFRKMTKVTAGIVLATMLIGWASTRALDRYGFGPCENEAVHYISSPGGGYRAVIFYRSCGATTGFVTNVSLLKGLGVVNHSETGTLVVASGKIPMELNWTSATHLVVTYPSSAEPRLLKRLYQGVTIDYVSAENITGK
jgi:hypothetical protein